MHLSSTALKSLSILLVLFFTFALGACSQRITSDSTTGEPAVLLFSTVSDGACDLDLYSDGTYIFQLSSQDIVEEGTWTWVDNEFLIIRSDHRILTGEINETTNVLSIQYRAEVSRFLTEVFSVESETWEMAFGTTGTYEPTEEADYLFSFSSVGACSLNIFENGTYEFTFSNWGLSEVGTWTWTDGIFSMIQSDGNEIIGEMNTDTNTIAFDYSAVISEVITVTFTIGPEQWELAWGDTGSYTPV